MKAKIMMGVACLAALVLISCGTNYDKTKSGFAYKIFKGNSKDSVAGTNNVVKFNVVWKYKDSVLYDSHGKMPQYAVVSERLKDSYSYLEILPQMRKGDSAVIIQVVDTLFNKGYQEQFAFAKKGDRINIYLKILEVFRNDSTARADADREFEKDKPRQEQEMKEMMAKRREEAKKQRAVEFEELKKSGEIDKEEKEILDYLKAKNITDYKKAEGTFVVIKDKGTGAPAVDGKFVTVKYEGRVLATDSVFQASEYIFPLGEGEVIQGWDQGIPEFNEGGKGTLYIPGYLAYGKSSGPPANRPFAALIFEIEVLNVSDTREMAEKEKFTADSLSAAKVSGKPK